MLAMSSNGTVNSVRQLGISVRGCDIQLFDISEFLMPVNESASDIR